MSAILRNFATLRTLTSIESRMPTTVTDKKIALKHLEQFPSITDAKIEDIAAEIAAMSIQTTTMPATKRFTAQERETFLLEQKKVVEKMPAIFTATLDDIDRELAQVQKTIAANKQ